MKINKLTVLPLALAIVAFGSIGQAGAQVASPRVALQFATNGLTSPLAASTSSSTVARLLLDTTGSTEGVRIATLPFNLIVGGGGNASTLNNCRVYNESSPEVALNSNNAVTMASGINSFVLNNALVLNSNTMTTLALRCDVASTLVSGSTYTVNMNTNNVVASGVNSGLPAAVSVRGGVVVPPVVTPPFVPGIPSTGAGGQVAQNVMMLFASLLLAGLGFSYLKRKSGSQA